VPLVLMEQDETKRCHRCTGDQGIQGIQGIQRENCDTGATGADGATRNTGVFREFKGETGEPRDPRWKKEIRVTSRSHWCYRPIKEYKVKLVPQVTNGIKRKRRCNRSVRCKTWSKRR